MSYGDPNEREPVPFEQHGFNSNAFRAAPQTNISAEQLAEMIARQQMAERRREWEVAQMEAAMQDNGHGQHETFPEPQQANPAADGDRVRAGLSVLTDLLGVVSGYQQMTGCSREQAVSKVARTLQLIVDPAAFEVLRRLAE